MVRRTVLLSLLVLACTFSVFAQRSGGGKPPAGNTGGGRTSGGGLGMPQRQIELIVHVVLPNDRPAGEHIPVRLEAAAGGVVNEYFTNSEGQVTFANIRPGTYIVRIRGGGNVKETTSGTLYIDAFDSNRHEFVRAEPDERANGTQVGSTQGSVAAAELNIPGKARKEFDKGNEAYAKGDTAKATEHYKKATDIYPKYAMAYNNLGAIYMKSSDKEQARAAWNKAIEADPNLASANANIGRLEVLDHNYQAALPLLQKALSVEPKNGEILLLMAQTQFLAGHYDQALDYSRKVHSVDHEKLELAHIIAGRVLEMQNHPDEARAEYQLLIKEAPTAKEAEEARKSLSRIESVASKR